MGLGNENTISIILEEGVLSRRGNFVPLLRCVAPYRPTIVIPGDTHEILRNAQQSEVCDGKSKKAGMFTRTTMNTWTHGNMTQTNVTHARIHVSGFPRPDQGKSRNGEGGMGRQATQSEIGMPTHRTMMIREDENEDEVRLNMDLLQERREAATIREAKYKTKMEQYYNQKVRPISVK
ncbi:hypothetical protein Tco_1530148 [Tanacetum coccineum]